MKDAVLVKRALPEGAIVTMGGFPICLDEGAIASAHIETWSLIDDATSKAFEALTTAEAAS